MADSHKGQGSKDNEQKKGVSADSASPTAVAKLHKWYPSLSPEISGRLLRFVELYLEGQKTLSLLTPAMMKTPESFLLAEAIEASKLIVPHLVPHQPLYDLGLGLGYPGIVFALLNSQVKVVVHEEDQRKSEFFKSLSRQLKIENLTIQNAPFEKLPDKSVHNLMAKGFTPLHKGLLLSRKTVPKGGKFFHLRGDGWANELASVPSQLFSFWSPHLLGVYKLPDNPQEFAVLLMDKTAE